MLNKLQLKELLLSSRAPIDSDGTLNFELVKVVRLFGDLLYSDYLHNKADVEENLCDLLFSMVKIYKYEFLTVDSTVDIIFEQLDSTPQLLMDKENILKSFLSNVITTNAVNFSLFNDVLSVFGFTYEYLVKRIAANMAMSKFKSDFDLDQVTFFGFSESEMIDNSIGMIGDYDGPYIERFYQGLMANWQDKHVCH